MFGALITVLALAIDPFSQQITRTVLCYRTVPDSKASIPRAQSLAGLGIHTGGGMATLDPGMSSAITIGLLNNSQSLDFTCPTGNCTFPAAPGSAEAYQTLAIESACVDISNEVKRASKYYWYIPQLGDNSTSTTVGGPNITRTMAGYNHTAFQGYWPEEGEMSGYLLRFTTLTMTVDWDCYATTPQNISYTSCLKPFAAECRLWPTVQTLSARVNLGKLEETVLTSERFGFSSYTIPFFNISSRTLRNGSWHTCRPSTAESPEASIAIFNNTFYESSDRHAKGLQWYPPDCVWYIDYTTYLAFRTELDSLFEAKALHLMYGVTAARAAYGSLWIKSLYRNGTANISTVETLVGQLATSMTAYTRINPNRDQSLGYVYGSAIRTETCIRVQWAWLAFPASLVLLTFAFLSATIWRTRKQRHDHSSHERGAWKSSSLAVLFAGLDETVQHERARVATKADMRDRAEDINVSLVLTGHGWRLRNGREA